jgi:large subunit ribosomal protein L29|tara:strand:+ start:128 stop:307 length:180 start_codon:yes stop_codon:yes gene_type:complete
MSEDQLLEKLGSLKTEYIQVRSKLERGLVKENQSKVKPLKRDIARLLTILNERKFVNVE